MWLYWHYLYREAVSRGFGASNSRSHSELESDLFVAVNQWLL